MDRGEESRLRHRPQSFYGCGREMLPVNAESGARPFVLLAIPVKAATLGKSLSCCYVPPRGDVLRPKPASRLAVAGAASPKYVVIALRRATSTPVRVSHRTFHFLYQPSRTSSQSVESPSTRLKNGQRATRRERRNWSLRSLFAVCSGAVPFAIGRSASFCSAYSGWRTACGGRPAPLPSSTQRFRTPRWLRRSNLDR